MNSIYLNGVKTYCFASRSELIDFAFREKKSLIAINAEKILNADEQTRELMQKSIGFSDGIGAVWALKRKGRNNVIKIPGCELWLDIIRSKHKERTFYIIGSSQEVIEETIQKLKVEFPGIKILNYRNGYINKKGEKETLLKDIARKKPDVVLVAMGSPKQEQLISEMQQVHPAVYQGLGGSLDVYTGNVKRAPKWWLDHNLEWAYRLIKQPSRIKRQIPLIKFLWMLMFNKV